MFKTRRLIIHIIMVALILGMTMPVFAEATDQYSARETSNITITFTRNSNTSASSVTSAVLFATADSITGTLTLQEKRNGSWVVASGSSPVMQSSTVNNRGSLNMYNQWNLVKGKTYRLKMDCVDRTNGITSTMTSYSNSI